jgi:hypothetical protein
MDKRQYLLKQLTDRVDDFKADSERHKHMYRRLRYSLFFLTSLSTLLAGLSLRFPESSPGMSVAILSVSAVAGVLTSIEGLRKPAELWIHERTTYYMLMDLRREIEFAVVGETSEEAVGEYFSRMQQVLGASAEKWNRNIVGTRQAGDAHPPAPGDSAPATLAGSPSAPPGGRP